MKREIDTGWIKPVGWIGDGGGGCVWPDGGSVDPFESAGDGGSDGIGDGGSGG